MTTKSVLQEAREVQLASVLITLGARLQFLEAEVDLSRERLVRLYKEIKGVSPPKGLLPFSADWYMTWLANIHASLFLNVFVHMRANGAGEELDALIKAYEMYLEQVRLQADTAVLDFTRAYTLVRFYNNKMVQLTPCGRCTGKFVTHLHEGRRTGYVCVLCRPPSRAGKPRRNKPLTELVESARAQEHTRAAGYGSPATPQSKHQKLH